MDTFMMAQQKKGFSLKTLDILKMSHGMASISATSLTHAEPKGQHVLFLADEDGRTMRQKVLGLVVRRGTVCINGEHNEVFNLEAPNRNITWYATRTISGWERFFNKERGSLKIGIQVTNISRDTMHNYANTRVYLQTTVLITHISVFRW